MKFGNTNIGGMSFGSTKIGGAKFGNTLVFQPGGQPQPVMIPYIRGGANGSYIDTGITADNTVRVIVWARNFNPATGFIFGSRVASAQSAYCLGSHAAANTGRIRIDYNQGQTFADDQFANLSHYHKYELYQGVLKVDDVEQASATDGTFSNNINIHLLGVNTNGTHENPGLPIDICACQIYKGGNLVRNYTAVNTPSSGLYDAVSETLFTNAGSGSFTYGEFDRNAYTPLEYIECTGAQYFDSGAYGTYSGTIVSKFMPTNTTPQWTLLLGFRTSTNSCDISLGTATAGQDNMRCYWRFGANNTSGNAFNGSTSNKLTNKAVVAYKLSGTLYMYYNNAQIGSNSKSGVSSSFRTTYPMAVGTIRTEESAYSGNCFIGRLYYVGFDSDRSFVPAKKGSRVGKYDTYNDVFYESESGTPFIAGPTI